MDHDSVIAERENVSNLKRPKSHDYTLGQELHVNDQALEVYTGEGWVPIHQVLGEGAPIPKAALRGGYQSQPWLDELFSVAFGKETASSPWAVDFKNMLTTAERGATDDYRGIIYANINTYLRGLDLDPTAAMRLGDDRLDELVAFLDDSIQKGVLKEPGTFHRGVNISRAMQEWGQDIRPEYDKQVGEVIHDPAFVSTSLDEAPATDFATGGGHKFQQGSDHRGVIVHYELPAGYHMNLIDEGWEAEHLLPRDQPFRVIKRQDKAIGRGGNIIHLWVVPDGEPRLTGVRRLMLGDPPLAERNLAINQHLAATDPEQLRGLVAGVEDGHRAGQAQFVEESIAKAEAARPPDVVTTIGDGRKFGRITPEQGLEDIKAVIDEDQLPRFSEAWDDTRYRMEELMHTSDTADEYGARYDPNEVFNSNDTRALAGIAAAMPSRGGRGAVTLWLNTLEQALAARAAPGHRGSSAA